MRAEHNYVALTVLHLDRREFYRMHPGLFYDLVQIHNSIHKKKDDDID